MNPPPSDNDDRRIVQQMLGYSGGPAFVRRVKRIEEAERTLAERLRKKRDETLPMVRLRIGQLVALAGDWEALRPLFVAEESFDALRDLHDALQPELRLPLEPTQSLRTLRHALAELMEAIASFNRRWQTCLAEVDLAPLNALREGYNKYYVLEKECALGNARVARLNFKRLEPIAPADLLNQFPLLPNLHTHT